MRVKDSTVFGVVGDGLQLLLSVCLTGDVHKGVQCGVECSERMLPKCNSDTSLAQQD